MIIIMKYLKHDRNLKLKYFINCNIDCKIFLLILFKFIIKKIGKMYKFKLIYPFPTLAASPFAIVVCQHWAGEKQQRLRQKNNKSLTQSIKT